MMAFPDLKHKLEVSEVTLGLLSNITPTTPKGIETFFINKLFGLFHFFKITLIGSFKLLTLFIALHILLIFFKSIVSLSIKLFFSFFLIANLTSLLFCLIINLLFFFD